MPRLLVIKGADQGKHFDLDADRVTIGRDTHSDIRLHDTEVSRRHAEFFGDGEVYRIRDVGSVNGTFVNNQPIEGDYLLQPGDRIKLGQTILVYSSNRAADQEEQDDLADQISVISRHDLELPSAIVSKVGQEEGSQILAHPERVQAPWLRTALANLAVMYEASRAISHIVDLNELLSRILELVFRSIAPDRGCIMLVDSETGAVKPAVVRRRHSGRSAERMTVSRTIIEHVLEHKEGVLLSDAARDSRFTSGQSIIRYGIREVICVPMTGRHGTIGVLYLDTTLNPNEAETELTEGRFTKEHLRLAVAIAHQAALAVEETRYHQAMLQAERLAAIGHTIAALSHHIKNILQGLRTGSDILKMGLAQKNDALLQQGWKIVEKKQSMIYDLVMDMLSYSKERRPSFETIDPNSLVQDVCDSVKARAEELGVRLDLDLADNIPTIEADPAGIHHALLNIVSNAIDAVEERDHGHVRVGTRLDPQPGWIRIVVRDNGPGIPPEKADDVFKLFVSSKGSKGTGLGLPVSRKILREHGGDIVLETQPGKGCKFILRLPIENPLASDGESHTQEGPIIPPTA